MSKSASTTADKNIVDRSRTRRNKAVFDTVKLTRERLQYGPVSTSVFERDMLQMHVLETLQSATIMPLFIVLATGIGIYISRDPQIVGWAVLALSAHALALFFARKASRQELNAANLNTWNNIFLTTQIVIGLTWVLFALQKIEPGDPSLIMFYKGSTLLIALSITSMSSSLLRRAMLMTFLPVLVALCVTAALSRNPMEIGLALMFSMAMLFCHHVTKRLYLSNLKLLSFQSEKDDLIAELEVAKSMSDEARRRAEEANMAKSRFLASMSHELRTPLNAILGFSEVMASEVLGPLNNPLYKEYSGDIHRSGQHLLDLINEILDLSRIEAGRYDLQEEAIGILEIAEDCVGMIQLRARAKNIRISQQFENTLPHVWADEKAMRQVILNLLSNAVKFTPQGGEISIKAGWTASGGQYVSIKDNGPGIPEDEIPVVLSAFGQGSIAIKSAEQGTGLGLPIVQAILSKHDGQFVLKSRLREGTEVIAILPAKRVLQSIPAVEDVPVVQPRRRSFA
ncbi:HAMP domain-containing histidine kinase [Agrobacterium rubi]|uniref:sensor histidine kinase n=1 Tax=Agrobacterium rubi TaxID=28099 RepID=UPI001574A96B|nr:HAMP domain-containing sensor histidine kinase [Agrobacterium rubi]MCL6652105.1 two-component sensor histidine kinase [Agrobacterium rubi]NTF07625.1 HAMP domain-containing histidine kinase [Agrobacterium rubi]NTF19759.1 HAMP domain-containing histidine kinase [Agrobacterium rubi]NTF26724.1 HAMP domain-containing histidine kinase [Agrobacterium rubi]